MLGSENLIRIKQIAYKKGRAKGLEHIRSKNLPIWLAEEFIESFAEGFVEGYIEGYEKSIYEMIKNFLSVGTPIDLIIKASDWTKEKILELAKKENIKVEEI